MEKPEGVGMWPGEQVWVKETAISLGDTADCPPTNDHFIVAILSQPILLTKLSPFLQLIYVEPQSLKMSDKEKKDRQSWQRQWDQSSLLGRHRTRKLIALSNSTDKRVLNQVQRSQELTALVCREDDTYHEIEVETHGTVAITWSSWGC